MESTITNVHEQEYKRMAKTTSSCSSEQWSICRTSFLTIFGINLAKLTRVWLALISLTAKINSLLFSSHSVMYAYLTLSSPRAVEEEAVYTTRNCYQISCQHTRTANYFYSAQLDSIRHRSLTVIKEKDINQPTNTLCWFYCVNIFL